MMRTNSPLKSSMLRRRMGLARFLLASYPIDISRQLGELELSPARFKKIVLARSLLTKINLQ